MKNKFTLLAIFLTSITAYAQQDKQFTHYNFDRMSFNPAATGFKGLCATFIYRNQWDRVQDAPNTTLLNVEGNISRPGLGYGLSFTNDAIGFQRNNTMVFNLAKHISTNYGTISGGIGVGLINVSFSPIWIPPQNPEDPFLPLPTSGTSLDVNAGLFWSGRNQPYYVGISTTHLVPKTLSNINYSIARHYYVLGGYNFKTFIPNQLNIKPSFLIKADGATSIFDINVNADYWINSHSYLWGGLTYRLQDAVAICSGFAFSPKRDRAINFVKIGYSFDIMTNRLDPYGKGTHEIMLNFCFNPPTFLKRSGNPFILE